MTDHLDAEREAIVRFLRRRAELLSDEHKFLKAAALYAASDDVACRIGQPGALQSAIAQAEKAEAGEKAALKECAKYATQLGECEGKLEASNWPVIDDWKRRAEKAERERDELRRQIGEMKDEFNRIPWERRVLIRYWHPSFWQALQALTTDSEADK